MNFSQNISNSELVSVADYLRDHGRMEKLNTIRFKISFYLTGLLVFFYAKLLEHSKIDQV